MKTIFTELNGSNRDVDMKLPVKIPFSGFYESTHDAMFDSWLEYEEGSSELSELFYSEINWKSAHIAYAKAYCGELETLMLEDSRKYKIDAKGARYLSKGRKITLEFIEMTSPREYNFETNCIYANIKISDLKYMLRTIDAVEWREFVKDKCTSYDGFISYYPNDFNTWEKDLSVWGEARLGLLLEFYLMQILESDINEALSGYNIMERLNGNGFISDCILSNASIKFLEAYDHERTN